MLTVHLVPSTEVQAYADWQKEQVGSDIKVLVSDPSNVQEAQRDARDAAVLSRDQKVLAVVPHTKSNVKEPAFTREWKTLADEVFSVVKNRRAPVHLAA